MFWGISPSIHLIGIGGSGMCGIAEVLLTLGFPVSGSDLSAGPVVERLKSLGAKIFIGHSAKNIESPTCVVVSAAIGLDNPECIEAQSRAIPIIPRAEMLAELMRLKMGIAVAGSHGKTTTTSMVGQILQFLDATVVVGGRLQTWNSSTVVGKGSPFVIEADESDRSFLKFSPVYTVVTNVDREHLDTYRDIKDIEETFLQFMNRTAFFGCNWIWSECPSLTKIRSKIVKPTKTYGRDGQADLKISDIQNLGARSSFKLSFEGSDLGVFELSVPGIHNIYNATAAVGIGISLKVPLEKIKYALKNFVPADRRLQIHFESEKISVVEDYGHHPTEISATLEALKQMYPDRKIAVVFQPHRYTRTKSLFDEFSQSMDGKIDHLMLLPIYAAHEPSIPGITSDSLAKTFSKTDVKVVEKYPSAAEVISWNKSKTEGRSSVLLILGAGPLTSLAVALGVEFK